MDFLLRDQAPLLADEWLALDQTVEQTARTALVGRRFLHILGPLGPGVQAVPDDRLAGSAAGAVDLLGNAESADVQLEVRRYLPLPLVYKDFVLPWRDLELSRQLGSALDTSGAAAAADAVAHTEDSLIFNGNDALDLPGLRNADGVQHLALGDWSDPAAAFASVVAATEALNREHLYGPAALVTGAVLYAQLNRMFQNSGMLALEHVQKLVRGGVYQTTVLPDNIALVIAASAENLDLAMGLDIVTGYLTAENLNHRFRVLESVVLRLKRPQAIVVLEG